MRAAALLVTLLACARRPSPTTPRRSARQLLDELVAIDTSNPPGNEEKAAKLVAGKLRAAGIESTIVPFGPGRVEPGRAPQGRRDASGRCILLAHLDVVGAAGQPWSMPPFTVTERDGWLYGRGVTDDKSWAAMATALVIELKRTHAPLHRDVILALTGDEESGGAGIRYILDHRKELLGDAEFALNEGGGVRSTAPGKPRLVSLGTAEKTFQDFSFTAHGVGGHSSVPNDENAIYRLARALDKLSAFKLPDAAVAGGARQLARRRRSRSRRRAPRRCAPPPTSRARRSRPTLLAMIDAHPLVRALTRTTCVATHDDAAARATTRCRSRRAATVNCRIMPVDTIERVRDTLRKVAAGLVDVEIVPDVGVGPEVPNSGPVRDAVEKATRAVFGKDVPVVGAHRARRQRLALPAARGDRVVRHRRAAPSPTSWCATPTAPTRRRRRRRSRSAWRFCATSSRSWRCERPRRRCGADGAVAGDRAAAARRGVSADREGDGALGQVARAGGAGALARADAAVGRLRRAGGARAEGLDGCSSSSRSGRRRASTSADLGVEDTPYPHLLVRVAGGDGAAARRGAGAPRRARSSAASTLAVARDRSATASPSTLRHGDGASRAARFDWVVGCDGAHSVVRHAAGLEFEGAAYEQDFVLADLRDRVGRARAALLLPRQGAQRGRLAARRRLKRIIGMPGRRRPRARRRSRRSRSSRRSCARSRRSPSASASRRGRARFRLQPSRRVALSRRAAARRRRCRAHPQPGRRAGHEHGHPGRDQPRLEAGARGARRARRRRCSTATTRSGGRSGSACCSSPIGCSRRSRRRTRS